MNPELIIWDYGKEITVTLEDALYSPASQGMTWGGKFGSKKFTLYGEVGIQKAGAEIRIVPCHFIIDSFSDFEIQNKLYIWTVCANIVSTDNTVRERIEDVSLYYDLKTQKWSFSEDSYSEDGVLLGDIDGDEVVTVKDTQLLTNYLTHKIDLNEQQLKAADVNQDGSVNVVDLIALKRLVHSYDKNNEETSESIYYALTKESTGIAPPQEAIYQIDHALQNVYYLDRIEKCRATQTFAIDTDVNTLHGNYRYLEKYSQAELTVFIDPRTMQPYEPNTDSFTRKNGNVIEGNLRVIKQYEIYYKWTRSKASENTSLGHQISVDAIHFPGTYRLVGETYSRSRKTGKDQRFQFEIPLCKMGTENNLTLEAEGDPTTFNMTLKVLRREDGVMMKLTQYSVENAKYDGYISDSTNIIPNAEVLPEDPTIGSD